jgi:hypothetical protein
MHTLDDILNDDDLRNRFLDEGVALIEREVAGKRGLSGMALKTGYGAIRRVRPDIVRVVLEMLLPAFAPAIEPYFAAGQEHGNVGAWFARHDGEIADALLSVTDARADRAKNKVLKRTYAGLRGQAREHTVQAVPGVGQVLAGFV